MITLRNKIAQMLIMGFCGTTLHDKSPVALWLGEENLGGVLLFDKDLSTGKYGKNLQNKLQIKQLNHQLRRYAEKSTLPLLIAVDYEGGAVDRFTRVEGCLSTMRASQMAQLSQAVFHEEIAQMADLLKELDFNLNFAPVVDLNCNESEGIIGRLGRSFSKNPLEVEQKARSFVEIFSEYNIACAYKHFPGHGSASGDTHEDCVDVTHTWQREELEPYRQLDSIRDRAVMVMTAHVINRNLDDSGLPASLSYKMLTGLLRQELGFDGVIVSDDLQMHAISKHFSLEDALMLTINAGADMLIFGNQLGDNTAFEVIEKIERLVHDKKIAVERIDEAYRRIVRFKNAI